MADGDRGGVRRARRAGISTIRSPSATPDGEVQIYRKRNLVFWERFRFQPGRAPLVVSTPWGRVGFAICADMIYRKVWNDYRDRIDLAVVSAAWPDFADRDSGRRHWLFGHVGPLSGAIPAKVAAGPGHPGDLRQPVRRDPHHHPGPRHADHATGSPARAASATAGTASPCVPVDEPSLLIAPITLHQQRGLKSWRSTSPSAPAASSPDRHFRDRHLGRPGLRRACRRRAAERAQPQPLTISIPD